MTTPAPAPYPELDILEPGDYGPDEDDDDE